MTDLRLRGGTTTIRLRFDGGSTGVRLLKVIKVTPAADPLGSVTLT